MEPADGGLDGKDKYAEEVQGSGEPNIEEMIASNPVPSGIPKPKEHVHSRSLSLDTSPGTFKSSQSFGARFNKIPNSISVHGGNKSVNMTQGPPIGVFRVGVPSRKSQSQEVLLEPQEERPTLHPIITQHQNASEWRKLPAPSQVGQPILPAQLAKLPSLSNMVNETVPLQDSRFSQVQVEQNMHFGGTVGAIADRMSPAGVPLQNPHQQSLSHSRYVNPNASHGGGVPVHQDLQNPQNTGNTPLHSSWYTDQQTFNQRARHVQPEIRYPTSQNPENTSQHILGRENDPKQARIRQAYNQYLREQAESVSEQYRHPRQDKVSQDDNSHHPMLGNVRSFGPAPLSTLQQGQIPEDSSGRLNAPTPTTGGSQARPYLLSPALSLPSASPLTPSFLDPVLIPQTYDAIVQRYQKNKALINRWIWENERYLSAWSKIFQNQQRALGPFNSSYSSSNVDSAQVPRRQPQESLREAVAVPIQSETPGLNAPSGPYFPNTDATRTQLINSQPSNQQSCLSYYPSGLLEVQNTEPPTVKAMKKSSSTQTAFTSSTGRKVAQRSKSNSVASISSPPKKANIKARNPKGKCNLVGQFDSKQPSMSGLNSGTNGTMIHDRSSQVAMSPYAAEIAAAGLPPPRISDAALLAAGITPKPKPTATQPKRSRGKRGGTRTRKSQFPAEGLRVSESLRSALLAGGATELPPRTSEQSAHHNAGQPGVSANTSLNSARFPESAVRFDKSVREDDQRATEKDNLEQQNQSPEENSVSETNLSSPDAGDDPKDGDYNIRTPHARRTVVAAANSAEINSSARSNRSTGKVHETSTVPAKRRSSAVAAQKIEKRSRLNNKLKGIHEEKRASSELSNGGDP